MDKIKRYIKTLVCSIIIFCCLKFGNEFIQTMTLSVFWILSFFSIFLFSVIAFHNKIWERKSDSNIYWLPFVTNMLILMHFMCYKTAIVLGISVVFAKLVIMSKVEEKEVG